VSTWVLALADVVTPVRALVRGRLVHKLTREVQIWWWRRVRPPERLGPRTRRFR
jgi:hypothetical protein